MRHPRSAARSCALAAVALLLAPRPASAGPPPALPSPAIRAEPRIIEVGMFYRGTRLRVEATAPAGFRLALTCIGKESTVELRRKAKVWKVLWRNVGSISFDRVPTLYLASAELEGDGLDGVAIPADPRLGPGLEAIEATALPAHADEFTRRLFQEFVRLKVAERLYGFGKLSPESPADLARSTRVSAEFQLPASTPPGVYEIRMIGYRDGRAHLLATEEVALRRVGLARLISTMAEHHGLLYGVLSVALAVAAGLLTGVLFAGSRKGH